MEGGREGEKDGGRGSSSPPECPGRRWPEEGKEGGREGREGGQVEDWN